MPSSLTESERNHEVLVVLRQALGDLGFKRCCDHDTQDLAYLPFPFVFPAGTCVFLFDGVREKTRGPGVPIFCHLEVLTSSGAVVTASRFRILEFRVPSLLPGATLASGGAVVIVVQVINDRYPANHFTVS